jgi:hypothetical protein
LTIPDVFGLVLLYVMIVGSFLVSSARPSGGPGPELRGGMMARPERLLILSLGLLLGPALLLWVLGLLAVATWGTVVQRILYGRDRSR